MDYYQRIAPLREISQHKSLFLFGPRSTGKSTLLKDLFNKEQIINLLLSDTYLRLSSRPSELVEMIASIHQRPGLENSLIIIDEIQKIPQLLNEVHNLIESQNLKFILTGSSARSLRRQGVNLLAGRAWRVDLFPLNWKEIGENFILDKYLVCGGLPQVYSSEFPQEELDAYINTYLKEEIKQEAYVRNLSDFSRFLKVAALSNGRQINFSKLSQESGVALSTLRSYMEIMVDSFLAFYLEPWQSSRKRIAVSTPKFYFFDTGIVHFLRNISVLNKPSDDYGQAFEHFIAMELRSYLSYKRKKKQLYYWRTKNQLEVDFIIGDEIAIEVKTTHTVIDQHLKGLRYLEQENIIKSFYLISFDSVERLVGKIHMINYQTFLTKLWNDKIV